MKVILSTIIALAGPTLAPPDAEHNLLTIPAIKYYVSLAKNSIRAFSTLSDFFEKLLGFLGSFIFVSIVPIMVFSLTFVVLILLSRKRV